MKIAYISDLHFGDIPSWECDNRIDMLNGIDAEARYCVLGVEDE